jgi:hypothetical protein
LKENENKNCFKTINKESSLTNDVNKLSKMLAELKNDNVKLKTEMKN